MVPFVAVGEDPACHVAPKSPETYRAMGPIWPELEVGAEPVTSLEPSADDAMQYR